MLSGNVWTIPKNCKMYLLLQTQKNPHKFYKYFEPFLYPTTDSQVCSNALSLLRGNFTLWWKREYMDLIRVFCQTASQKSCVTNITFSKIVIYSLLYSYECWPKHKNSFFLKTLMEFMSLQSYLFPEPAENVILQMTTEKSTFAFPRFAWWENFI